MPRIIGFFGTYPADICLYTAFALKNTGKSVCVADLSKEGVLHRCIPAPERGLAVLTYRGVDFIREAPLEDWQDLEYEYVFVQLGRSPQELCLAACDELALVVDCERANLDFYNNLMRKAQASMSVILRNLCPDGVSGRMVKEYFERENCFVQKWLTLPFDEADEAYRIEMQYGTVHKFSHVSCGMERLLGQLLRMFLTDDGHGGILRAVKAAKKGKVIRS